MGIFRKQETYNEQMLREAGLDRVRFRGPEPAADPSAAIPIGRLGGLGRAWDAVDTILVDGIEGDQVAHLPDGCPFAPRCSRAEEICTREFPPFVQINENHHSLCHFANEVYAESLGIKETA